MMLAQEHVTLTAGTSVELEAMVDAHQARLLAELDAYNQNALPMSMTVSDCSGRRTVVAFPPWVPSASHGLLGMTFSVQSRFTGTDYRADVCMTLSDDATERD